MLADTSSSITETYLNEAGRVPRFSADDERARLRELVELRKARWEAIMSYGPLRRPIMQWLRKTENFEIPARAKIDVLATRLVEQDRDGEVVERLQAALEGRSEVVGLSKAAERLAREDEAYAAYRDLIRASRERLHRARNRFVSGNLGLVVMLAKRYSNRLLSLNDRVQEGNLGLLKAVERFDPERGTRFSTYAAWWIRHSITRALVNRGRKVRIPAHLHVIFNKSRAAEAKLQAQLAREPTEAELAAEIELPLDKVIDAREAMKLRPVALDTPAWGEDGTTVADQLEAQPSYNADVVIDHRRNYLLAHEGMDELEEVERDIIEHRFALYGRKSMTLRALGERHSLSRERIRQLQNRGLSKLRGIIESSDLPSISFAYSDVPMTDNLLTTR